MERAYAAGTGTISITTGARGGLTLPMSQLGIPDSQQPGDAVEEGQAVELKVLEVDPIHHRIVLAATGFPKDDVVPVPASNETPRLDA